ncbi:PDZ/DHR/GLGF domain protein, partial [Trichinella nativa]
IYYWNYYYYLLFQVNKNETDRTSNRSGKLRTVLLKRNADEGLGLSITGGREHGVPILISDIHENQVADRVGLLKVGDAILSVNGIDLIKAKHAEAVKILSEQVIVFLLCYQKIKNPKSIYH